MTKPYGWVAEGVILFNGFMDDGVLKIGTKEGIPQHTIPWRYIINGLVYVIERESA
jgi:hypothetical protein